MSVVEKINRKRSNIQKIMNNTFIWSTIAFDALDEKFNDTAFLQKGQFEVPSKKGTREIKRSEDKAKLLLEDAIGFELYFSLISYIVAQFEGFLSDIIKIILEHDSRKLLICVTGINHQKNVKLDRIVLSDSKESLVSELINDEIISIFYASPKKQCEYFKTVLGIELSLEHCTSWFEYKATRDLIVHNNGIVNDIYLAKAISNARNALGEKISVDGEYFESMIKILKSFSGKISTSVKLLYADK